LSVVLNCSLCVLDSVVIWHSFNPGMLTKYGINSSATF